MLPASTPPKPSRPTALSSTLSPPIAPRNYGLTPDELAAAADPAWLRLGVRLPNAQSILWMKMPIHARVHNVVAAVQRMLAKLASIEAQAHERSHKREHPPVLKLAYNGCDLPRDQILSAVGITDMSILRAIKCSATSSIPGKTDFTGKARAPHSSSPSKVASHTANSLPITSKLPVGYTTCPAWEVLARMPEEELAAVPDFRVVNPGIAQIQWLTPVDVRGIDLVGCTLSHAWCDVYSSDTARPPIGQGLNMPAQVTLFGITSPPGAPEGCYLQLDTLWEEAAQAMGGTHVLWDEASSAWTYQVLHF